jgi:hypothetical protein
VQEGGRSSKTDDRRSEQEGAAGSIAGSKASLVGETPQKGKRHKKNSVSVGDGDGPLAKKHRRS